MKLPISDNLIINEETMSVISQLAESIPGGFFIYHAYGGQELIYYNSHLVSMFGCETDEEFEALTGNSFKGIVHPEDYAFSEASITDQIEKDIDRIDHVKYRFVRKDGSIGMMDDYGHFSHSETFGDIYYVFVQDITDEEMEKQKVAQLELLNRVQGNYDGVFIIDCAKDTRRTLHDRLYGAGNYDDAENYSSAFARYVDMFVCEPDYDLMHSFVSPENILKILGNRDELSFNYRDKTTGVQRFYEMRIIRYSETEVLQSFRESDAEMVNSLLFKKLEDNYFAIFGVDLESGLMRSYKDDPLHVFGNEGQISEYSTVMMNLASYFEDETRDFFIRNSDPKFIKESFARQDKAEYIFRSPVQSDKWTDVTGIVLSRNEEGAPSLFCITFNYLDEKSSELQDMQEKLKDALNEAREANKKIAEQQLQAGKAEQARKEQIASISGTESTYIVNPYTDRFVVLGQTEYLDENYPDNETYTQSITRYIENDVFEHDRKSALEDLSIRKIVNQLESDEEYTARFRDITKDYPRWYEMRAVKLSDTEILLGFSDKDTEIIEQMLSSNIRENYFGLYYINLDSSLAQIIRTGHPEITGEAGISVPYSKLTNSIASASFGEAADFFRKISDIEYIRNRFSEEDFAYHVYKSYIFEGNRWVNYTGRVLQRHEDGSPAVFALALSLLDEEASIKEEANLKLQKALEEAEAANRAKTGFVNSFKALYQVMYLIDIKGCKAEFLYGDEDAKKFMPIFNAGSPEKIFENFKQYYVDAAIIPEDRERVLGVMNVPNMYRTLKTNNSMSVNYQVRRNLVDPVYTEMSIIKAGEENGELSAIIMAFRMTDEELREALARQKKELEIKKQLQEALDQAKIANKAKTDFLFNMSHDIRTPMNAILGFTGMAHKYIDDKDKISDYLDKIDTSGQQLLELINQVLEMSRIESGKLEFKETPVKVMEQYNALVTVLVEQAKDKGLEFHHSLSDVIHNNIFADTAKMSSITMNIAGNALKYTPAGGRIDYSLREITSRKPGCATYVFTVEDTGMGMSEEFIKTIYEPFSREKTSTVSKIQGTGLGMSIVKELVDFLGGEIEVQSEPGKGTRFDITVDFRINREDGRKTEEMWKTGGFSFEGRKVLLVEDNEMNRDIATDILEDEGLEVETAEDGIYAVEMLKEKGPDYFDFILMDIQMPVMNGYEATKAIRAMYPEKHIPMIAVSANAFEEDRIASREAGLDDHVAKPIKINELLGTLNRFMEGK